MDFQVENKGPAAVGVWTENGHAWVKPGASVPLAMSDEQARRASKTLSVKPVEAGDHEPPQDLAKLSVNALKDLAAKEEIDLGDATKKLDIIAAIELAREEAGKE